MWTAQDRTEYDICNEKMLQMELNKEGRLEYTNTNKEILENSKWRKNVWNKKGYTVQKETA